MKKLFLVVTCIIFLFILTSCDKTFVITYLGEDLNISVGETKELVFEVKGLKNPSFEFDVDNPSVIRIDNNTVIGLEEGNAIITVQVKDEKSKSITINVTVYRNPSIKIIGEDIKVVDGESLQLEVLKTKIEGDVIWSSSAEDIATISNDGIVQAICEGETTITARCGEYVDSKKIIVTKAYVKEIVVEETISSLEEGTKVKLSISILPNKASKEYEITSSNNEIINILNNNNIQALKEGKATISIKALDGSNIIKTIDINVLKGEAPVISCVEDKTKIELYWNQDFDVLDGLSAIDSFDGDISSNIKLLTNWSSKEYGEKELEYSVKDKAGNQTTFTRSVNVKWNRDITFIGHAGSYFGIMNTEDAFLYAVRDLHYQALECDLKQTKDGVFVMCHDDEFGGVKIANTNYADLKDIEVTSTRNAGYPKQYGLIENGGVYTSKICTLERYLEICKEYNAIAVIELKSSAGITSSNQSRMQALMDEIEKNDMLDNVIFLGSQYNCLIWTRQNGYQNVPCQYLVNSCESDTYLQRCIDNNLDISINVTGEHSNSDEWIAKYKEAGLKVSTYTFTQYCDYDIVQTWIDKGVDFVTCDWVLMENLNIPLTDDTKKTYEVTFKDVDGKVLKVSTVVEGRTAAAPKDPVKEGYTFVRWDKDLKNVTSSFEVQAVYEICEYTIKYEPCNTTIKETQFNTKEEFVNELYTDLYNWFKTSGKNSEYVTVNGDTITIVKNSKTASFNGVEALKSVDIYDYEKTIGNFLYKPFTRNNDGTPNIEEDDNYFFNSKEYKDKYSDLDQYFYNCMKTSYTSYNTGYGLSSGRVQIFFRFQQWVKGTKIAAFDTLPKKCEVSVIDGLEVTLPTSPLTYTINDEVTLPTLTSTKTFLGWFLDKEYKNEIKVIEKGSFGNITLYAKWEID